MITITGNLNFNTEYYRIKEDQKFHFEDFSLQYANSLIAFYKANFNYIEEFDFREGTNSNSDFVGNFMSQIDNGLRHLTEIHQITNEEIFKSTSEFWFWFCFKLCFLKERTIDPDSWIPEWLYDQPIHFYIAYTKDMFFFKKSYYFILEVVKQTIIRRMTKPVEVKIDVDETGEIILDEIRGTIYQSLHETMRDTLVFLTHLDPNSTEEIMTDLLRSQSNETQWNPNLLFSLCWSIGCIAGAMEESHEKRFVVVVIKQLLNLCELKKGKNNKAIVASNIMYVVGQYPRFLNFHWKFLKTVVKKLFEFMHEPHPGVQVLVLPNKNRILLVKHSLKFQLNAVISL